jgi:uncharacterized membrane protein
MESLTNLFTSFGLSTSAGLNAYLPLLIVALVARFTGWIELNQPFDVMTSWWVIGVISLLLAVEIVADKIPIVDSINDVIQTFIRPTAGAILFAANANAITNIHPVLAMICGLLLAGGVHAVKATVRPAVTATTGGTVNPFLSTAEDLVSALTALLAVLLPTMLATVLLLAVVIIGWWLWTRHQRRAAGLR